MGVLDQIKTLWRAVRSNPILVAAEGGAGGAIIDYLSNGGQLDFSSQGRRKLAAVAFTGALTAVKLLYRAVPGTNPNPK
jgi:hypothetical protein